MTNCPDPNCRGTSANYFRPMTKGGWNLPSYGYVCTTMHRNIGLPSDCGHYREGFSGEWKVAQGKTWTFANANHQEMIE